MRCDFGDALLSRLLPPVLVTEAVLGLLGNGLALWIFCVHLKPWKSSTVLLFNLAVADFVLITALPFRASYYVSGLRWAFGDAFCNICLFMLAMNRSGSTFFLLAIAVDRYMRVLHPHHTVNSLSVAKATLGALAIWLVTIPMSAHIFSLEHANTTHCESFTVNTSHHIVNWHTVSFLFSFFFPLSVILYCTLRIISHLRGRQLAQQAKIKKALFFLAVVVVLFVVCFLPSNIVQLLIWTRPREIGSLPPDEVCPAMDKLNSAFYISISLTYLNSTLDPVVYYFSIPAFKNICRRALRLSPSEPTESTEKKTRESASQSLSQL